MKVFLALLLTMVLCLSLAACGENENSDNKNTNPAICAHGNIVTQNGIAATCTTNGMSEGKVCGDCGKVLVEQTAIAATGHSIETVAGTEATCTVNGTTESEKCSACGLVTKEGETIPALGHTGGWSCERCSYSAGAWDKYYFVDEFDDPTDEWYIGLKANATGTFSNSATTDSKLDVYILYGQTNSYPDLSFGGTGLGTNYFNIFLYEYGNHQVKNSSTYYVDDYLLKIKTESGKVYEINCVLPTSQDRIWVYDHNLSFDTYMTGTYATDLMNILKEGGKMKIVLVNTERPVQQYTFEIDASNFADELAKLG